MRTEVAEAARSRDVWRPALAYNYDVPSGLRVPRAPMAYGGTGKGGPNAGVRRARGDGEGEGREGGGCVRVPWCDVAIGPRRAPLGE